MISMLVNVDVPDLAAAIDFYRQALGLRLGRRLFDGTVAELLGGSSPIYLLTKATGSAATTAARLSRDYGRHWTPVHLDFEVEDVEEAVRRARAAGAALEGDVQAYSWGDMATMSDPFGHGFCLVHFRGRGYDALA
jgi:catechol 2,3-dioxygenase-like lactoylglutathione lyase family enzyme